ncbi:MAG: acyltransferase [Cyanobacteria bacterium J06634_6]
MIFRSFTLYFYKRFKVVSKGIKCCLSAIVYLGSEFESLIISAGDSSYLRRYFLRLKNVSCGEDFFIGHGFRLYKGTAKLEIGERFCAGENCGIYVHGDIEIGDDFLAAPGLTINSGYHDIETLEPGFAKIKVGSRVWCGVNATILAGAFIGDDCVIGANALVKGFIPSGSVAVGTPARVVKNNIRKAPKVWSCYHISEDRR